MDKIHYGCTKGYLDGLHVVIKKDEKCLIPSADCFWKDFHDLINTVKTCTDSKTKNYRLEKYDELF